MNDNDDAADAADAAGGSRSAQGDERKRRMTTLSERLVNLYDRLEAARDEKTRVLDETDLSKGVSAYRLMRQRQEAPETNMAALADDIARTQAELRAVQSSTSSLLDAERPSAASALDVEILAMDRQLSAVAAEQTAAVNAWNTNPAVERRAAFESQRGRLHAEFESLLNKKKALLQRRQGL